MRGGAPHCCSTVTVKGEGHHCYFSVSNTPVAKPPIPKLRYKPPEKGELQTTGTHNLDTDLYDSDTDNRTTKITVRAGASHCIDTDRYYSDTGDRTTKQAPWKWPDLSPAGMKEVMCAHTDMKLHFHRGDGSQPTTFNIVRDDDDPSAVHVHYDTGTQCSKGSHTSQTSKDDDSDDDSYDGWTSDVPEGYEPFTPFTRAIREDLLNKRRATESSVSGTPAPQNDDNLLNENVEGDDDHDDDYSSQQSYEDGDDGYDDDYSSQQSYEDDDDDCDDGYSSKQSSEGDDEEYDDDCW